jgi:transposase
MRFYTKQHKYYCGIDLHTKKMYVCVLNGDGEIMTHRNLDTDPDAFLELVAPFREDVVVAAECMFTWYWVADLCAQEGIPFVLGHALYMKAIHGGKSKNDKIDSHKIAVLLRGGMIPQAYVYPAKMRSTRDLLRRRNHLVRKRAELFAHIQNTKSQYNLPEYLGRIAKPQNRSGVVERFDDPSVRKNMEVDLTMIEAYDRIIIPLEREIIKIANGHDALSYHLLQTIPGVGRILALVMLYEIESIDRFETVQDFSSYARLVKCKKESNGKNYGTSGKKIGNAHLKWAFSEASVLFIKGNEPAKKYLDRLSQKHGKGKALSILAHKLGRAAYYLLKNKVAFEQDKFLSH